MSTAAAADGAVPAKSGKKKLVIVLALVLLLLAAGGGALVFWLKAKAHAAQLAEEEDETGVAQPGKAALQRDPKVVPVFVPLDPFTVNLADRQAERYAQVGITLEMVDAKAGDRDQGLHAGHPQQHPDGAGAQAPPTCWTAKARRSWPKNAARDRARARPGAAARRAAAGSARATPSRCRCTRCTFNFIIQ